MGGDRPVARTTVTPRSLVRRSPGAPVPFTAFAALAHPLSRQLHRMHDSHEKGITVTHLKHPSKTRCVQSGISVTVRAVPRVPAGGGAFSRRPASAMRALVTVALAAAMAFLAAPSPARAEVEGKGVPTIEGFSVSFVHSTRAKIEVYVKVNGSVTEGHLESAPGPADPWTPGTGRFSSGSSGKNDFQLAEEYLHLIPSHTYYVRVKAKNGYGEAEKTFSFTTPPVAPPEVGIRGYEGESGAFSQTVLRCIPHVSSGECEAEIDSNGANTEYHFEDSTAANGIYMPVLGCAGSITVAEDFAFPKCQIEKLTSETTYFVRVTATNSAGPAEIGYYGLTTLPAHPQVGQPTPSDVTSTSAELSASFKADNSETSWQLQYATSKGGEWKAVPGGSGTTAAAEATEEYKSVDAHLTGLSSATAYYVRLFAENGHGGATSASTSFKTGGPPAATAFAVHTFAFGGEAIRLLGSVEPGGSATNELQTVTVGGTATGGTFTLTLAGQTTQPIPYSPHQTEDLPTEEEEFHEQGPKNEPGEEQLIEQALDALPNVKSEKGAYLYGGAVPGSYTVEFAGPDAGVNLPQMTADASGLTPSGTVSVATLEDGAPLTVDYHFQYVTREHFEREGFSHPAETQAVEGSGVVGQDLPGLQAGESYHYRLVASSSSAGHPIVESGERTLVVPASAPEAPQTSCPNEPLRSGPSASLPDCRAYEQVTPSEKAGSQDTFKYGVTANYVAIGEDGEHLFFTAPGVHWGSVQQDPLNSNYVFSRGAGGWQMTSAALAPKGGVADTYQPNLFSADLTQLSFAAVGWATSETTTHHSPEVQVETGPPGGPYVTIASVPRESTHVVAASGDFGKIILTTTDRSLIPGHPSKTTSGDDLYEYSAGRLQQLNVAGGSPGSPISACGARLARGDEGYGGSDSESEGAQGSPHSVSADGARVFFEDNCTHHLYMRVNGAETVDLGEYAFVAANAEGSQLLVKSDAGEVFLYNTEAATTKLLFRAPNVVHMIVSEDLAAVYFASQESLAPEAPGGAKEEEADIYRYDVSTGSLQFITRGLGSSEIALEQASVSPDGQYLSWQEEGIGGAPTDRKIQVYRYDSAESVVQCMSCASAFDPEPKYPSIFLQVDTLRPADSVPNPTVSSSNGDYVFFDTISALVPQDVDGEIPPEIRAEGVNPSLDGATSPSSDVYEWRKNGIDGCSHVQGCLALITSGRGGFNNILLGTDPSGRDVFFATHESLVPQDDDTAADIYDARIGGGYPPPPPRAVECEGDACSTPPSAPNDTTPSSFTFSGMGNIVSSPSTKPVVKVKKPKAKTKKKGKKKRRGKVVKRRGKAKKSAHGAGSSGRGK
jgi:hypothetical protein